MTQTLRELEMVIVLVAIFLCIDAYNRNSGSVNVRMKKQMRFKIY